MQINSNSIFHACITPPFEQEGQPTRESHLSDSRKVGSRHCQRPNGPPNFARRGRGTSASSLSRRDSDLEAFSHNPPDGSFAPMAYQPST
ncbi:unnamed protein product [Clavelina lepadiformis]|uniref:Uncharacterized protein n=1 Tax=Clavelina lepadiformis TaxID=159417 RepID=A0ABP0G1C2_CLALP